MAVIWSSLIIILLYISRKKRLLIKSFGISTLLALYWFCTVRLLIPIELPFTRIVEISWGVNRLCKMLFQDSVSILGFDIPIAHIFLFIWVFGSVFSSVRWINQYLHAKKRLLSCNNNYSKRDFDTLSQIAQQFNRKLKVTVCRNPSITIPMGIGILKKTILLPRFHYSDSELHFIILHEYTHFQNRDIIVKLLIQLFCNLFWWNPIVGLLKRDLDQALEIKCDLSVTEGLSKSETAQYLQTIVNTMQYADGNYKQPLELVATQLFNRNNQAEILERFKIVAASQSKGQKSRFSHLSGITVLSLIILLSYSFQIQSSFTPPDNEISEENEMTPSNTFLVDNEDGTYSIFSELDGNDHAKTDNLNIIYDMINQGFKVVHKGA
ncbi:M56 family metallopeptidase [Butyricicoccus faecihominis]|uniref:M56 family metallopeptidase n=1 Tax=Butyricicoccus faecihominis TaxID=1712515 RepID=UPI00247A5EA8|nr:M56 family metallopeptidase [Butyricicoccus faecihominis]MCQ5129941.1 M56 family metallopeptidase [Butyricicoccus faecihominis]